MPFSISQMLGGFRKKDTSSKRKEKVPRHAESELRPERAVLPGKKSGAPELRSSTSDVKSQKTSDVFPRSSAKGASDLAWSLIVRPHISEKSTMLGEGKYVLKVASSATKGEVKRAVGDRYGVKVAGVRILNMPSKQRRRGNTIGMKSGFKKAIITLAKGQLINEF